jgi:hypothetical protein
MFNAPIPGESLTKAPKQYPWERPPEKSDPEEVLQAYVRKLNEPDRMEGIMDALEVGLPLKDLVEGLLRTGVSNGIHSVDVSLIVAPVIHEYIKSFADELGVEYDEGFEDKEQVKKDRKARTYLKTKLMLEKKMKARKIPKASTETIKEYEEVMEPEVPMEEAKPEPLIARRTK